MSEIKSLREKDNIRIFPHHYDNSLYKCGVDILPPYTINRWYNSFSKFRLQDINIIWSILQELAIGDPAVAKAIFKNHMDNGTIMGAVAVFSMEACKFTGETMKEVFGTINQGNIEYLNRMYSFHLSHAEANLWSENDQDTGLPQRKHHEIIIPTTSSFKITSFFGKKDQEQANHYFENGNAYYYEKKDTNNAYKYYMKAAKSGNSAGEYAVGYGYETGEIGEKNLDKAFNWYAKSYSHKNTTAMVKIAYWYYSGIYFEKDEKKAVQIYHEAAELGNMEAQRTLGIYLYQGSNVVKQNYLKAIDWFKRAFNQGDSWSAFYLGQIYEFGDGVEQNIDQAVLFYKKGVERGNADSHYRLAKWYRTTKHDIQAAISLYENAYSACGDTHGLNVLGDLYVFGIGVRIDFEKAYGYYKKAMDAGNKDVIASLGYMYECGMYLNQDYGKAISFYNKARDMGSPYGTLYLGRAYLYGYGVKQDLIKAFDYFAEASENGLSAAFRELANCYGSGYGTEKDMIRAAEYYVKAAGLGDIDSQLAIGRCYRSGSGVCKDNDAAEKWLLRAVDGGSDTAKAELIQLYEEQGKHKEVYDYYLDLARNKQDPFAEYKIYEYIMEGKLVTKNVDIAEQWLQRAASHGDGNAKRVIIVRNETERMNEAMKGIESSDIRISMAAFERLKAEADNGNKTAAHEVAEIYYNGRLGDLDYFDAKIYYLKAGETGMAEDCQHEINVGNRNGEKEGFIPSNYNYYNPALRGYNAYTYAEAQGRSAGVEYDPDYLLKYEQNQKDAVENYNEFFHESELPENGIASSRLDIHINSDSLNLEAFMSTANPMVESQRDVYDSNGMYAGRDVSDGHGTISHYDSNGRLIGRTTIDSAGNGTFYDDNGMMKGRSVTDSSGNTTYYDENGMMNGRSSTDSSGSTTYYDSSGRFKGRSI